MSAGVVSLAMLVGFFALVAILALIVSTIVLIVRFVRRVSANESINRRPSIPTRPALAGSRVRTLVGGPAATVERAVGDGTQATNPASLATWRYGQLLELDVDPITAIGAALAGVDPGSVRALVECGCPPLLALSILEPDA